MKPSATDPNGPKIRTPIPAFAWVAAALLACSGTSLIVLRWLGWIAPLDAGMIVLVLAVPTAPVVVGLAGRAWRRAQRRRREAARNVQQSRDYLQAVIDSLPVSVMVFDRTHRVEVCSRHGREHLLWDDASAEPVRCHQVFGQCGVACPQTAGTCPIAAVIETRSPVTIDHPGGNAAGDEAIFELQAAPVLDQDGGIGRIVATCRDVTEQRRRQDELERARSDAEAAGRARGEFLANMSREIRDPLTSLLGFADLLSGSRGDDEETFDHLQVIRRSGQRLLGMINDVLDLSRMETGRLALERQPVSPAAEIAMVAGMMQARAKGRGDELSVEYATDLPRTILSDSGRLRRVLIELVDNAVRFTENGRVRIVASYLSDWQGERPAVRIRVVDTGIGIDDEDLPFLFEPFSGPRRRGLGLCVARRITEMLGGELKAGGTEGKGSVFTLTIPAEAPAEAEMVHPDPREVPAPLTGTGAAESDALSDVRVLLVDDSPDHRRLIAELLARAGAEADVAEDAPHAVAKVRARTFDVVLIDLQLPQADGPAAARALRAAGFDGPVVALTANALAGDRQRSLEAGCNEYLIKPVDADLLVRTVAALARATPDDEATPVRGGDRPGRTPEPIRSELADEAALASVLQAFVAGLPKQLDAMREALADGHHEELKRRAHQLKGAGGSYGYPALTDAAGALEQVARTRDLEVAQLALQELTVLCQAIADGHTADRPADAADPPAT